MRSLLHRIFLCFFFLLCCCRHHGDAYTQLSVRVGSSCWPVSKNPRRSRSSHVGDGKVLFGSSDGRDVTSSSTTKKTLDPGLRKAMGAVATVGLFETAYLTFLKLTGEGEVEPVFCSLQGSCGSVLNSPYASVFGGTVPLSALGVAAYLAAVVLSLSPLFSKEEEDAKDDSTNSILLVALTSSMGTFSVFLMSLLAFVIHEPCPYCVLSAVLSTALASMSWLGRSNESSEKEDTMVVVKGQPSVSSETRSGLSSAVATAVLAAVFFASTPTQNSNSNVASAAPQAPPGGYAPPTVTTSSSESSLRLANSLQKLDGRMFGAFWCSHCYDQKQTLGKESMGLITYVECARDGRDSQAQLCRDRDVPGYPTWEISGKLYPGEKSLEELEELVDGLLSKQ